MPFHVHLPGMTMFDTLQVAAGLSFTGRMTVVSRSKIARLSLLKGRLVAASVDGVPRVGERLLKERVISRGDLQAVLERQGEAACELPLGLLVSSMGLADARDVRPVVLDQLREACSELLKWADGSVDLCADTDLESLATRSPQVEISGFLLQAAHLADLRVIQKGPEQYGMVTGSTESDDAEVAEAAWPEEPDVTDSRDDGDGSTEEELDVLDDATENDSDGDDTEVDLLREPIDS